MAWGWSHTPEAYANAQANLEAKPKAELEVIYAEWLAHEPAGYDDFNQDAYAAAYQDARSIPASDLADTIWRLASNQAICNNGGFDAWVCPYGCGSHAVSFSKDGESYDDRA
jgi:hypothetical protein